MTGKQRRPLMTSEARRILELAAAGQSQHAIARQIGRCRETVRRYLRRQGVTITSPVGQGVRWRADEVANLQRLLATGERDTLAISRQVGRSSQSVRNKAERAFGVVLPIPAPPRPIAKSVTATQPLPAPRPNAFCLFMGPQLIGRV
jgi:biotin operon repressor